ncbi:tripartite tricarboxylate transporter permease [Arthrobacter sp. HMWF013]|uniref:tripartite tricarboxylate transporter permease n=1 Tax=Arthrobacter sp. HMWF013 TaxID=2056849 RepID=UPI000D3A2C87|nr:tripartite tricarboxylate transporter permease [Arthrobacter sp. HMWF013]PTT63964.1 transporter [Arthrobacter sp. HMWF013]
MDIINDALGGFDVVLQPANLLFCLVGVTLGMLIGVLPGLGPAATIAILLPLTYTMEPASAIILLAGIFYGAQYGGTITSVLLRLPGEASSVVTALDGYQMARQGRAGAALGIAAVGSFIGGTIAIVGLTFLAPLVASFALDFGPAEYALLAMLGILLVSSLGNGSARKAAVSATIGLLLATVGRDPVTGVSRFTFGSDNLADGIDFVIIAMGLFGVGEILYNMATPPSASSETPKFKRALPTRADLKQSSGAITRGSVSGFMLGILPGGGATIASLVAYATEKKFAKKPERFGRGAIEGVAGPETANNAAATSSFIPLLTLGIPANGTMAIMFGALLLQGITPGPGLINDHPDIFWGVIDSMYIGNVFLLLLSIPLIGIFVKLLSVKATILNPITVLITMIGVYTVRNSVFDMFLVIIFGVVGYLMKKLGFPPGPLVLAFVLGGLLETSFRQAIRLSEGSLGIFVSSPISITLAITILIALAAAPVMTWVLRRQQAKTEAVLHTHGRGFED